eukprot:jgi/Mesvir1/26069/Mv06794-RA.1
MGHGQTATRGEAGSGFKAVRRSDAEWDDVPQPCFRDKAKDQEMRERRNREVTEQPPTEQTSREKRRKLAESMGAKVYYFNDGKGGGQRASSGHRTGNLPLQGQPSYKELKAEMVAERENRSSATSPPPTTSDAPSPTNVNQGCSAEVQL